MALLTTVTVGLGYLTGAPVHHGIQSGRAPAVVMQQNSLNTAALAGAAQAATAVMEEVSKSVGEKGVEAPEARSSFVSMDSERAGLVDEEGLPLIYDKDAIQKYWADQ